MTGDCLHCGNAMQAISRATARSGSLQTGHDSDERDRHRVGADTVACDAAGGVGGAAECGGDAAYAVD